jgi:hypothetical protein
VNPKAVRHSDDDLWSFVMLPDADQVSTTLPPFPPFIFVFGLTAAVGGRGWASCPYIESANASVAGQQPRRAAEGAGPGSTGEGK